MPNNLGIFDLLPNEAVLPTRLNDYSWRSLYNRHIRPEQSYTITCRMSAEEVTRLNPEVIRRENRIMRQVMGLDEPHKVLDHVSNEWET